MWVMLGKGGRKPHILREKPGIGGGKPHSLVPKGRPQVGQTKGITSASPQLTTFQRTLLPLPLGEVDERSEDGEGTCKALSVTFGDSSPRGRAKGLYPHFRLKNGAYRYRCAPFPVFRSPIKREGVVRVGQCPRFPLSPIDTAPDSGYTEL